MKPLFFPTKCCFLPTDTTPLPSSCLALLGPSQWWHALRKEFYWVRKFSLLYARALQKKAPPHHIGRERGVIGYRVARWRGVNETGTVGTNASLEVDDRDT